MTVNRLEFSNSEAGDNFEVMRVCMGKRSLAQSCVLYEVTRGKGFSNSEAGGNFEIMRVCMGRGIWPKVVFYMK